MSDNEKSNKVFTPYDEQRKKLEKLMMDPEKPVYIPSIPKEQKPREPREFIRNIWGSSAGVGSGDFHIYRGIRRRQMEREEYMEKTTEKQKLNEEYAEKRKMLEEKAEEKTAKKRLKRQKKKLNKKAKTESDKEIKEKSHKRDQEKLNNIQAENSDCSDASQPDSDRLDDVSQIIPDILHKEKNVICSDNT